MGADDCVTKPFSTRELIARLRAALRRTGMQVSEPEADQMRTIGSLKLDQTRRQVWLQDTEVVLTATEFDVLWTLTTRPGHVCSRSQLREEVYGAGAARSHGTVRITINRPEVRSFRPKTVDELYRALDHAK